MVYSCGLDLGQFCFFFQAEDGIRDLVRSRGLGDVYKRQVVATGTARGAVASFQRKPPPCTMKLVTLRCSTVSVSYTHLTLPTSDLV